MSPKFRQQLLDGAAQAGMRAVHFRFAEYSVVDYMDDDDMFSLASIEYAHNQNVSPTDFGILIKYELDHCANFILEVVIPNDPDKYPSKVTIYYKYLTPTELLT